MVKRGIRTASVLAIAGFVLSGCDHIPAACMPATCYSSTTGTYTAPPPPKPRPCFLSDPYPVYTNGAVVVNTPYPGFTKKYLPAKNIYKGNDGCYVACYSHSPVDAIYSVSNHIYVHGQLRIPGYYIGRICVPHGYEHRDISASAHFRILCDAYIPSCNKNCWAGGDTGGWCGKN